MTTAEIEARLGQLVHEGEGDSGCIRRAAELAGVIYAGVTRDQGTPYVEHPIAVTRILFDEIGMREARLLAVALLHDALEIRPHSGQAIADRLGDDTVEALRAMTPDYRLESRVRRPEDDAAYRAKVRALPDQLLAVRLADRVHNLRELPASTNPDRHRRFLDQLAELYMPLADERGRSSPPIRGLRMLLEADITRAGPVAGERSQGV